MTTELLPCPFCGGVARFGQCAHDEASESSGAEYVECADCSACTALVFPLMDGVKHLLVERWNRRSPTTPTEGPALLTDEQILEIAHDAGLRWPDDEPTGAQDDITIAIGRAIESKVRAGTLTDPEGAS